MGLFRVVDRLGSFFERDFRICWIDEAFTDEIGSSLGIGSGSVVPLSSLSIVSEGDGRLSRAALMLGLSPGVWIGFVASANG